MLRYLLLTFALGSLFASYAQDSTKKKNTFVAVPIVYYSPETRLGFGAAGIYNFRISKEDTTGRPCTVQFLASYTLNKQILLQLPFQLFLHNEEYYLYGEVAYYTFPYLFHGIGNDNFFENPEMYSASFSRFKLSALKRIKPGIWLGPRIWSDDYFTIDAEPGTKLDTADITGAQGGRSMAVGAVVLRDTRDNIFYPKKGVYQELSLMSYSKFSLSKYNFTQIIADIRKYHGWREKHVLAIQFYTHFSAGNVPFNQMALLGGSKRMRGYYEGGFRAKNMGVYQIEYRRKIIGRFGAVAFAGIGNVFARFDQYAFSNTRYAFGGGLRYRFSKVNPINFRLDYGIGKGTSGVYFTIGEAF